LPRGRKVAACCSTRWRACSKVKIVDGVDMEEMIRQAGRGKTAALRA
jgi:hypothetical protein